MATKTFTGITPVVTTAAMAIAPISAAIIAAEIKAKNVIKLMMKQINLVRSKIDAIKRTQGDILKLLQMMGISALSFIPTKASIMNRINRIYNLAMRNLNAIGALLSSIGGSCFKNALNTARNILNDIMKFVNKMINKLFNLLKFPSLMTLFYKTINFIISLVKKTGIEKVVNKVWDLLNGNSCIMDLTFIKDMKSALRQMVVSIGFTENSPSSGKPHFTLEEIPIRDAMRNDLLSKVASGDFTIFTADEINECFDRINDIGDSATTLANNTKDYLTEMVSSATKKPDPESAPSVFI